ncbi:hypothetical protein Tco_0562612 [Tanacetum coccineum]
MAARDSDDTLVCCIENTTEDRIMDSGASFHATYCKEKLERFKLRSSKVRLADDKILDIARVGVVVLKTYFGTSWTLKDVRYIPGLKRMLISVGQLDEEGYHVGFGDHQWKVTKGSLVVAHGNKRGSLYMVEDWWFGETEEAFLHNVRKDKETAETATRVAVAAQMKCDTAFRIQRVTRLSEAEISHLWTRFIEQGGSSDTSKGSKNSGSFEDSGRSDEEYSKEGASSNKEGFETPQNLKVYSWEKLVRILISEGSLSLLKILGMKSLIEMFTKLVMKDKLKFCSALTSLQDTLYPKSPSPAFGWCSVFRMFGGTKSYDVTPPDMYSVQAPFGGVTDWYQSQVIENQVMAISVISVSSDSSEESVGTSAGRVILFGTIPTTIPDTTPTSDLSEDPSLDRIPPLPATSPFLSLINHSLDSDTPNTPPSPTYGTPFIEITPSTHSLTTVSRALCRRVMILAPGQPIPYGQPYWYHPNGPLHMLTARKRMIHPEILIQILHQRHHQTSIQLLHLIPLRDTLHQVTSLQILLVTHRLLLCGHLARDIGPLPKRINTSNSVMDLEVSSDESSESFVPRETSFRVDVDVEGSDEPYSEPDVNLDVQEDIDECIAYADALRAGG